MLFPIALTAACLVSVLVLLVVDRREFQPGRVIAKLTASTCFVLVAFSLGAHRSTYGQLILGALVLGWMGDAFLLSRAPKAFMGGLAAFLLSHVLFAVLPHTPKEFKAPVLAYVVVILGMCVAATGHAFASERWAVLLGALLFTASDLSVARDRFVKPGYANRLWGWPTYFVAQLVLAWTVATDAGAA